MKASNVCGLVLVALVCLATLTTCRPPKLGKVFSTNFTLVADNFEQNPQSLQGFLAFNDHTGAGRAEFAGVEYVPLYLQTTFVADPGAGLIRGYWYAGPICWVGEVNKDDLRLFPLEIPPSAVFNGNETYNGMECSLWTITTSRYDVPIQFWVDESEEYPDGQPLAKVVFGPPFIGSVELRFNNYVVGNFSSSLYQPPHLNCVEPYGGVETALKPMKAIFQSIFGFSF